VLRVVDARGKEVAQNDDYPGIRADSALSFVAAEAGDYFIELRDVNYGGGGEFSFRLRVGDFPLASAAFPVAVERGTSAKVELVGATDGSSQASVVVSADNEFGAEAVSVKGRAGSGCARVLVAAERQYVERPPDDGGEVARRIEWPAGLNGRFDSPSDADRFEFTVERETALEFRARTRSIGSPAYVRLGIQSADGKVLKSSDPSDAGEGFAAHSFVPGSYRLVVRETSGLFGQGALYHVELREASGFVLSLETDRVRASSGGTFELGVNCERRDFKGPVALRLEGISGLTVTNAVIEPGKTNLTLTVRVPENGAVARPGIFEVWGRRDAPERGSVVRASTWPAWRKTFPHLLDIPAEFEGVVALGITAPEQR
jgi:hypothetical protein